MECFVYLVLIFKANLVSANMLAERTRLSQCSGEKKQKNRIIKKSIDTNRWQCFVVALSSRLFFCKCKYGPHVRLLVGRLVGRSVCHNFLKAVNYTAMLLSKHWFFNLSKHLTLVY